MSGLTQDLPFSFSLPVNTPDSLTTPEAIAVYQLLSGALRSAMYGMGTVTGMVGRDAVDWPTATPEQTILVQNHRRFYCKALVNIAYGNLVNFFNSAGIVQARLADSTAALQIPARGFALKAVAAGAYGEFIVGNGLLPAVGGLVANSDLYLGATGLLVTVAPVAVGTIRQYVGFGLQNTKAFMDIGDYKIN